MAHRDAPPYCCHIGVGVASDADARDVVALAHRALAVAGIHAEMVAGIATIDTRSQHPAIMTLAAHFNMPVQAFATEFLEAETPRLLNPSEEVFARIGCHGVAEAAALASAGHGGRLVVGKMKSGRATVAVALA
jgi:cobalamin biosynthesis protein CbiG